MKSDALLLDRGHELSGKLPDSFSRSEDEAKSDTSVLLPQTVHSLIGEGRTSPSQVSSFCTNSFIIGILVGSLFFLAMLLLCCRVVENSCHSSLDKASKVQTSGSFFWSFVCNVLEGSNVSTTHAVQSSFYDASSVIDVLPERPTSTSTSFGLETPTPSTSSSASEPTLKSTGAESASFLAPSNSYPVESILFRPSGAGFSTAAASQDELLSSDSNLWTGSSGPSYICNAERPKTASGWAARKWNLTPGWQIVCSARNPWHLSTAERNPCWVSLKDQCHGNLHEAEPWSKFREFAFQHNLVPSYQDAPFDPLGDPQVCDQPSFGLSEAFTAAEAAEALKWFQTNVAVFVINMPQEVARWTMISTRLSKLSINFTRSEGVDMRVPDMFQKAEEFGWIKTGYDYHRAQAIAYSPYNNLGNVRGTVGCAAAHFRAQARVIEDAKPIGLVLEDDSWLADDFIVRLWRLVSQELPCDWEVTSLLSRCPYGKCVSRHLARIQPDGNEPERLCRTGVGWGMYGTLYRTQRLPAVQEKWKRVVWNEEVPHCLDVDVALASISDQVNYYAVPAGQSPGFLDELMFGSSRMSINGR
jgi:hypothetical protein